MKLYNTLDRQTEDFTQPKDKPVALYTCGPTVYDYPHIGNWYTFVRYDELARVLRASGLTVEWVMNITDVGHLVSDEDEGEDKLEKGARRDGSTAWDVAKKYTAYFEAGLRRLNIEHPDNLPKATDHIAEQIALIQRLEAKGFTYVIDDGVYFDTEKFKDYGKMARLDVSHQREGARVEANRQKHHPSDFALWKFSPAGEKRDMEWDSPWGKGFPGWHIECSAMSMQYLGETLDIHGGGIDHIPVHHTNEIAQSEAATGKPFSRFWFHSNFNLVDGKKMSKSLGNFYTLEDVERKGFSLQAFRLLVLQSHYRTEAHFSWDNLAAAQQRLQHWQSVADLRWQRQASSDLDEQSILTPLQDDLDTPGALAAVDAYFDNVERHNSAPDKKSLDYINQILGIDLLQDNINAELIEMIQKRQKAREQKDWTLSDNLRDRLEDKGIAVRDTDQGPIWSRL